MSARGRFFITPTARQQWRAIIDPRPLSDEDIDDEIHAWADEAHRQSVQDRPGGATKYRTQGPLRAILLVDESERPLPALVGVLRPHARFLPGQFSPRTHRASAGRPREVSKPGEKPSDGNPMFRVRRDLAERVRAMGPGYLDRLIEADIAREGNMVASAPIEVDNSNPGHSYARFVLMFYGSRLISVKEPGLDRLTEADIAAETDRP